MSQLINRLNKTVSEKNETSNEIEDKIDQENLENEVIGSDEDGEEFTDSEYSESDKEDDEDIGEDVKEEDVKEEEEEEEDVKEEEEEEEEDNGENKVKDTELQSEENDNVIYIIKVNGDTKCYCSTSEEVNEMIEYIICKLKYKLNLQGWNNVQCITRDNKILWKVLNSNRIIAQLTGNRPNSLIFYENILSEIEVEIVKSSEDFKELLIL
jgi:hypothetical protein